MKPFRAKFQCNEKTKRIAVVHCTGGKIALGDRIRVEKILESLCREGFQVIDIRLPSLANINDCILTASCLKNFFLSMLPVNKLSACAVSLSSFPISIFKYFIWFNVSINYLHRIVSRMKPDVILAETPTYLIGWITSLLAKEFSLPCITDVHGLSFAESKGSGRKNWRGIRELEMQCLRRSSYLVVVSMKMKDFMIRQLRLSASKIIVAPNGSNPQPFVAKYKSPLKVIYAGNLAYWEKVEDFLEIAKRSDPKLFKFFMVGAGPLKGKLISRIKGEKIPVKYLGYIPSPQIFHILSTMQIGIAPSTQDLARIVASPIKVFNYMASGLPVITPKIGDWGDIVYEEDCGIALGNDNIQNYIEALNIFTKEDNWIRKSSNAITAIEKNYNWDKTLKPLVTLLSSFS